MVIVRKRYNNGNLMPREEYKNHQTLFLDLGLNEIYTLDDGTQVKYLGTARDPKRIRMAVLRPNRKESVK